MIHEIKMYIDLNEMNLDGFTILMSVTYEPRHGHFTTNCLEYHDIPMKYYHLVLYCTRICASINEGNGSGVHCITC